MNLQTYLEGASPDDWHQVAWNWNWDSDETYLRWIVRQPNCDRGTALLIYWYGQPGVCAEYASRDAVPEFSQDAYDLLMEIETRYITGGYTRQEIVFDPRNDTGFDGYDWTGEYDADSAKRPIPALMLQATPGCILVCDTAFEEGYPPGIDEDDDDDA